MTLKQIAALCLLPLLLQIAPLSQQQRREFATLEGRVLNVITGEPLAGVLVTSRMPQSPGASPAVTDRVQLDSFDRPVVQVLSDAEGRFSVRVAAGRATVVFGKDLYGVRTLTYTLAAGQQLQEAVVRLMPTGVITGRVVDSRSNPVPGARVQPFHYRYLGRGQEFVYLPGVTTNDRGEFRLANMSPGNYFLSLSTSASVAVYPGVQEVSSAEHIDVEPGRETRLKDVVLAAGSTKKGTIQVRLINAPGEGPRDVTYTLTDVTPNFHAPALDGNSLSEVSEGGLNPQVIHLDASATRTLTQEVSRLGRYQATVTWKLPDGSISLSSAATQFSGENAVIDLLVKMPEARLSCRVMLEDDGGRLTPLARVNVIVRGAGSSAACVTGVDGTQTTGPLQPGKYQLTAFQGIPAGGYVATATLAGQDALNGPVEVTKDAAVLDVRVRRDAGVIRGKITDSQGRSVHDAVVAAVPDSPAARPISTMAYPSDRTDQNGVFEIRELRPG